MIVSWFDKQACFPLVCASWHRVLRSQREPARCGSSGWSADLSKLTPSSSRLASMFLNEHTASGKT